MGEIASYRRDELLAAKEGVLLTLDPFSEEASVLRLEIAQIKRVNLDVEAQLERSAIEQMAAQLQAQGRMIGDVREVKDTRWQRKLKGEA